MTDKREVKLKLGWFNIFNLGGALYGWCHTHTWEGAVWGYLGVTVGIPLLFLGAFVIAAYSLKLTDAIADAWTTKSRIAQAFRVETQDQRWDREYTEHCKAHGLVNELGSAPIHCEPEPEVTTFRSYGPQGGGPG